MGLQLTGISTSGKRIYQDGYNQNETDSQIDLLTEPVTNLIIDHSFELLDLAPAYPWTGFGSPVVYSTYGTDLPAISKFGFQHVGVNATNYYICYARRTNKSVYTISSYNKRSPLNLLAGQTKTTVKTYASDMITVLKTYDFINETTLDWARVSNTFTLDATDMYVEITVTSTDSNYVLYDGIQLVDMDKPAVYEPEVLLFLHIHG